MEELRFIYYEATDFQISQFQDRKCRTCSAMLALWERKGSSYHVTQKRATKSEVQLRLLEQCEKVQQKIKPKCELTESTP